MLLHDIIYNGKHSQLGSHSALETGPAGPELVGRQLTVNR